VSEVAPPLQKLPALHALQLALPAMDEK